MLMFWFTFGLIAFVVATDASIAGVAIICGRKTTR